MGKKRNSTLLPLEIFSAMRWGYVAMVLTLLTVSGCMTARDAKYQKEVAMPMLIQENRQLEDELFYLREQLSRCCYDNQQLRDQVTTLQAKADANPSSSSSRSRAPNAKQENSTAGVPHWSPTR